ncbi:MAG: hypothetical protein OJF62_001794 [Pseudolabrys sp.]|nr:hypothetical protein [Pseudolabrys sp.]
MRRQPARGVPRVYGARTTGSVPSLVHGPLVRGAITRLFPVKQ